MRSGNQARPSDHGNPDRARRNLRRLAAPLCNRKAMRNYELMRLLLFVPRSVKRTCQPRNPQRASARKCRHRSTRQRTRGHVKPVSPWQSELPCRFGPGDRGSSRMRGSRASAQTSAPARPASHPGVPASSISCPPECDLECARDRLGHDQQIDAVEACQGADGGHTANVLHPVAGDLAADRYLAVSQ